MAAASSGFYAFGAVVDHVAKGGALGDTSKIYKMEFEAQQAMAQVEELQPEIDDATLSSYPTVGYSSTYFNSHDEDEEGTLVSSGSEKQMERRHYDDSNRKEEEVDEGRDDVDQVATIGDDTATQESTTRDSNLNTMSTEEPVETKLDNG
ncbi:MAG: hypothetical protein SGARI_000476, partial [Bacillariaceae sp.]